MRRKLLTPRNLDECFDKLEKIAPLVTKIFREASDEAVVSEFHFTLGQSIRNEWGLWKGSRLRKYFEKLGLGHPDDMSGIILTSFFRHLHERDIDLKGQVEYYKTYWLNRDTDPLTLDDISKRKK